MRIRSIILALLLFTVAITYGQQIGLYQQFNGRYDFTFAGNTLNTQENEALNTCTILTSSAAPLQLSNGDTIEKAFLYWAGSGTGDLSVKLNGQDVTAQRTFPLSVVLSGGQFPRAFFAAFADVTALVQQYGQGTYTLSDLDLTSVLATIDPEYGSNIYCMNGTNFGGWTLVVIYKNDNLPLNQLNLYDGMQYVPGAISISLPSLNVIDNIGAKMGFVAWEGDRLIDINEKFSINNITLSNSLNPADNAFNGTNSITGATNLYNMDLDVYDIEGMINVGDQTATIRLESGQDFVMVNAVITKLNSQLPDATVSVSDVVRQCNSRTVQVKYTVHNINSTDVLPAHTPVAVYANSTLIGTFNTPAAIPIGGSANGSITLTIPGAIPSPFQLRLVADQNAAGMGSVKETNEGNNLFEMPLTLWVSPPLQQPADVTACDIGGGLGIFNFSAYLQSLKNSATDIVSFYATAQDAQGMTNPITNITQYPSQYQNQLVYVRLQDVNGCFSVASFRLVAVDCDFPDATIAADGYSRTCNSRTVTFTYTISNLNSADILPAGTSASFYINNVVVAQAQTITDIPIGGSEAGSITLYVPEAAGLDYTLVMAVDDVGDGTGTETEIDENNNTHTAGYSLIVSPALQQPEDITSCNIGFNTGVFDFAAYAEGLKSNTTDVVTFHNAAHDAEDGSNPISNISHFQTTASPQPIYVRLETAFGCYTTGLFNLRVKKCPPEIYNYVTPNGDGLNDSFFVKGLRDIFVNFRIAIYNRWGNLVWTGDHSRADWDGIANEAKVGASGNTVPDGTYYFVLELNDPDYPEPLTGWVYVVR